MRSPYSVLGVKKSADPGTIKSAYRALAKTWHPDQNQAPEAGQRFAEITQAYKLLIDPESRLAFDGGRIDALGRRRMSAFSGNPFAAFREAWRTRPRPTAAGDDVGATNAGADEEIAGFDDMVDHIFGKDAARGEPADREAREAAGAKTQQDDDPLSVLDELFAKWKSIHRKPERTARPMAESRHDIEIELAEVITGKRTSLRLDDGTDLLVDIPAGTADAAIIRMQRDTGAGLANVAVTVRHRSHPAFRVEGAYLVTEAAIELRDAVLGGTVTVETLEGPVRLDFPPWTTGDAPLTIKGRGLPAADGKRGDMHVHLHIRLPGRPDDALVELMRSRRKSFFM